MVFLRVEGEVESEFVFVDFLQEQRGRLSIDERRVTHVRHDLPTSGHLCDITKITMTSYAGENCAVRFYLFVVDVIEVWHFSDVTTKRLHGVAHH